MLMGTDVTRVSVSASALDTNLTLQEATLQASTVTIPWTPIYQQAQLYPLLPSRPASTYHTLPAPLVATQTG
jgi:hypothetical protein